MQIITSYLDNYRKIPASCWILLFLTFIESIGSGLGFLISLYFTAYLHFSLTETGTILSCYGLGMIVGGFLGGQMVDRLSATFTNILSLLLFGLGFCLLAFFEQLSALKATMSLMGFASYSFIASNSVLILRTAVQDEKLRLKLLNLKNVASNLGMGLAAILLNLYGHRNFQGIFMLTGLMLFSAAFYQYKCYPFYESTLLKGPSKRASLPLTNGQQNSPKLLYITLICVFAVGLIVMQHRVTYPIFVKASFSSAFVTSLIFALNYLLIIFFQPAVVNFIGRYNKILMMGLGALGLSLGMLALNFPRGLGVFLISVLFYTLGEMVFFSLSQLLCYQSQREQNKGKAIGMWRVAYASSGVIGPSVGSFIYEFVGANTVWLLCGALGLLCYSLTTYLHFDPKLKLFYANKVNYDGTKGEK